MDHMAEHQLQRAAYARALEARPAGLESLTVTEAEAAAFGRAADLPAIREIIALTVLEISAESRLLACHTFAELHDQCDANMLGQTSMIEVLMSTDIDAHEESHDRACDLMNLAHDAIDRWLRAGRCVNCTMGCGPGPCRFPRVAAIRVPRPRG